MILKQFYLNCLAHASYLVGDSTTHVAAVVDPQRDIDQYLAFAAEHGLRITHVFLTHFHADFVAGHLELRDRTGATIHLGARAKAEYAFTPARDGDVVDIGRVRLTVLETPGHTVESISILVHDLDRGATEPLAVLTGDTLFVGDVGRPDLRVTLGWSPPPTSAGCCTTRCRRSSCRCRTRASSTRPTAPARCAAKRWATRRSRPSASSGAPTTRCSR